MSDNSSGKVINATRKENWDFIKGVLMFIVIWGHVCPNISGPEYSVTWNAVSRFTGIVVMPLFFFISGYFYKPTKTVADIKTRIGKTFYRLILPLVVWGFISVFVGYFCGTLSQINLKTVIGFPLSFFWYLTALIMCTILASVLSLLAAKISKNEKNESTLHVLSIIAFLLVPVSRYHFAFIWIFYAIGILSNKYRNLLSGFYLSHKRSIVAILLTVFVISVVCSHNFYPQYSFYNIGEQSIIQWGWIKMAYYIITNLSVLTLLLAAYDRFYEKASVALLVRWGKETLFVYVSHVVILCILIKNIVSVQTDGCGLLPNAAFVRYYIFAPIIAAILNRILYQLSRLVKKCFILNTLLAGGGKINMTKTV